jgi:hypothetical protein
LIVYSAAAAGVVVATAATREMAAARVVQRAEKERWAGRKVITISSEDLRVENSPLLGYSGEWRPHRPRRGAYGLAGSVSEVCRADFRRIVREVCCPLVAPLAQELAEVWGSDAGLKLIGPRLKCAAGV